MAQAFGRKLTQQDVMETVNVFITNLLDDPPEDTVYNYNPGMRCYEVTSGVNTDWTVYIDKAFPEDDGLRLDICELLETKYGIAASVVLEWE